MGTKEELKRRRAPQDESLTYEDLTATGTAPPAKKARTESRTSIFVRSLPKSATSEALTTFFSEHFPVKHATVVVDKITKESRGYGFVTFTDSDDCLAAKAKLNNHLLDGSRIRLEVAEPRHRDPKARAEAPEIAAKWDAEKERRKLAEEEARKPPKLIIRNLPWSIKTAQDLEKLFLSFGRIRFADLPQSKGKLSGFGFVTLRGRKNAENAMAGLNGKVIDGRTIAVDWAVDKHTWEKERAKELAAEKAERKVDRATEKETRKDAKGKKVDAKEAVKDDEAEEPKKAKPEGATAAKKAEKQKEANKTEFDTNADVVAFMEKMSKFDSEPEDDDDEDDGEESDLGGSGAADTSSEEEDSNDEDGAADDANVKSSRQEEAPKPRKMTDNSTTIFIRNVPYTTTDEELKAHFGRFGGIRYARVVVNHSTDRSAGTGFVCFYNLDEMKACVHGAPRPQPLVTKGSALKRSILQDETSDPTGNYSLDGRILQVTPAVSKEQAVKLSEEGPDILHKRNQDKRRLYLLHEGTITPSSALFQVLSPSEIKMRDTSLNQRKKMIQSNPLLHLSLTRLALRNIPRHLTSKDLKALAREAVVGFASDARAGLREPLSKEEEYRGGEEDREAEVRRKGKGKGIVTQAKIIFEDAKGSKTIEQKLSKEEEITVGKSRGYGFIEYTSHRWALMGLRWLNGRLVGGGDEEGKKKGKGKHGEQRLAVEFAIENAQVVARRKDMQIKSRLNARAGASASAPRGAAAAGGKPATGRWDAPANPKFRGKDSNSQPQAPTRFPKTSRSAAALAGWNKSKKPTKAPPPNAAAAEPPSTHDESGGGGGGGKKEDKAAELRRKIISRTKMMRNKKEKLRRAGASSA